ncbi:hypothetical protein H0B56_05665 [Haloechinothrix sp. YIM 98757]|uniref:Uncharacterized protein n=1 Tax=Haloechinothrix aidingensis TaxID=2752311 RepID=A0A837ZXY0_9PSEU|nr:hypothetical protein [Haloechinothrix aidingensis]MBA0125024.1 hypothetical protein [Haloechinothrix aidingensis]
MTNTGGSGCAPAEHDGDTGTGNGDDGGGDTGENGGGEGDYDAAAHGSSP